MFPPAGKGAAADSVGAVNFPYQHGLGVLFWGADIAPGLRSFVSMLEDPEQIVKICETFEKAGEDVVENAGKKALGRVKLNVLPEEVGELRKVARALSVSSVRTETDLAMALAALHRERNQPLKVGLRNKLVFKLLQLLIKASPPLSARTVARFQRSASKRNPDRGLFDGRYD